LQEVLKSDPPSQVLTTQEAAKRLEQYGPGKLEEMGRNITVSGTGFKNIYIADAVAIVSAALI